MGRYVQLVLRVVIVIALLGSLMVQAVMLPLIWIEMEGAPPEIRIPFVALAFSGVVALQVIGVCVWRLLTMVSKGTVFSFGAFRYVDAVIGALAAGAGAVFGFAVIGAYANRITPGDEIAPGLVGLICGLALVVAGVALLVYVMRTLLSQAVALDDETRQLQAELRGVI